VVDTLCRSGESSTSFDRDDTIWLCTLLRSGADPDEALDVAPGVQRGRLYAAWTYLEQARRDAADAWERIVTEKTAAAVERDAPAASRLLPAACHVLRRASESPERLGELCDDFRDQVQDRWETADQLSRRLELPGMDRDDVQRAGTKLWNPSTENLWNDPMFLPRRVGELTPAAVAELLADASPDSGFEQ
jgi:hypothetical protein